jgi:hypothetical protein
LKELSTVAILPGRSAESEEDQKHISKKQEEDEHVKVSKRGKLRHSFPFAISRGKLRRSRGSIGELVRRPFLQQERQAICRKQTENQKRKPRKQQSRKKPKSDASSKASEPLPQWGDM